MRLAGDDEGCRQAARELERCAGAVAEAQEQAALARSPSFEWAGLAADRWHGHLLGRTAAVDGTAAALGAAARALRAFANALAEQQERARRLVEQAAGARLVLDDAGWIAPVPSSPDPELQPEVLRRRAVRTAVLHAVRALQVEHDDLHTGLVRALGQEVVPSTGAWSAPSAWRPGLGDAPAAVLAAVGVGLREVADDGLRLVGRGAGSTPVGAAVTAAGELSAGAEPLDAAVTTLVVTSGATAGGGLAMAGMAGVTLLAAPVAVPAGVGLAAVALGGLVGGYVTDRLWDAHGADVTRAGGRLLSSARLPWVDRPRDGRRRRR